MGGESGEDRWRSWSHTTTGAMLEAADRAAIMGGNDSGSVRAERADTEMPVVLRIKGYRVWFYQADLDEPPHVRVGRDRHEAKFWMAPIAMARSRGFREHELNEIERILTEYRDDILRVWQKEQERRGDRESQDRDA